MITRSNKKRQSKKALWALAAAVGGLGLWAGSTAHAAIQTWDPSQTGPTTYSDGSGTWDSATDLLWSSNGTDNKWINGNDAVIGAGGAGPYTLTLGANISANSVTFNTPGGYTVQSTVAETLTITGGGLTSNGSTAVTAGVYLTTVAGTITSSAGTLSLSTLDAGSLGLTVAGAGSTTLSSAIANLTTLTKHDAGTLTLAGTNTSTGVTINGGTITGGTLRTSGGVNAVSATGTSAIDSNLTVLTNPGTITSTGTLNLGGAVDAGSMALTFAGAGNTTLSSTILNLTALTKNDAGTVTLGGPQTLSAFNVNGGTVSGGSLTLTGGVTGNGTAAVNSSILLSNVAGSTISNGTGTLTLASVDANNEALIVAGAGNTTLSSAIANLSSLTMNSAGTLTLGGPQTLSTFNVNGGTVSGGSLTLTGGVTGNGTAAVNSSILLSNVAGSTISNGTGTLTLASVDANNEALIVAGAGNTTLSSAIANLSSLTMNSAGTLTLTGTNTSTGVTINGGTITGGTLRTTGGVNATGTGAINSNLTILTNPGTITSTGTLNLGGAVDAGAMALTFAGAGTTTVSGAISNATSLTKNNGGVLILGGTNTYAGPTNINGTVRINAAANLGDATQVTNAITFNGGTLQSTGGTYDLGVNRAITLNGPGTIQTDGGILTVSGAVTNGANLLTVTGAGTTRITGVIGAGGGGVTMSGTGTLSLGNANTYTGTTTLTSGKLIAANPQALGNGAPLSLGGGTLDLETDTSINPYNTAVTGNTTIESDRATAIAAGTHTLGTLSIGASTLNIITGTDHASGTGAIAFGAVTLTGQATFNPTSANLMLASVSGAGQNIILDGTAAANTVGAITTVGGSLTKSNTSTWTLSGANTYTGPTTLNGGTVNLTGSLTGTNVTVAGATLSETSAGVIAGAASTFTLNSGTATLAGANTYGGLTSISGGQLTLSGTNNSTGATTATGGTLQIGGTTAQNGGLASGLLTLNNANFQATSAAPVAISNAVSFTANATFVGTQSLTINGATTQTAQMGLANNSTAGTLTFGTFNIDNVTGTAQTFTLSGAGNTTFGGVVQDYSGGVGTAHGALQINSTGTTTLSSANTYGGATTIGGAGTVVLGNPTALGPAATASVNMTAAATLSLNGNNVTLVSLASNAGVGTVQNGAAGTATLTVNNSAGFTYNGVFQNGPAGVLNVTKTNTGTWTLAGAGAAATWTGTLSVADGRVVVAATGTFNPLSSLAVGGGSLGTTTVKPVIDIASRTTALTWANTTFNPGEIQFEVANNAAANVVQLGNITRNAGSLVQFTAAEGAGNSATALPANSLIKTTSANANFTGGSQTILGGWAVATLGTGGGQDTTFVTVGAGGTLSAYPIASYTAATTGGFTAGKDMNITAGTAVTMTGTQTINSLHCAGGFGTVTINGNLTIATGGIVIGNIGGEGHTFTGTGSITSGNGQDLIIEYGAGNATSTETFTTPIVGSIGVTIGAIKGTYNLSFGNAGNTFNGDFNLTGNNGDHVVVTLANGLALQNSTVNWNFLAGNATDLSFGALTSVTLGGFKGAQNYALPATAAAVINVGNNDQSTTYSGVLSGLGGAGAVLNKIGAGTWTLKGVNTYTATSTVIQKGAIQLGTLSGTTVGQLPTTTTLTLGTGANSGQLILGDASNPVNQTLPGLLTVGTGTTNSVVGGNAAVSTLTLNVASGTNTFNGVIGGVGANQNNVALTKNGAGTLVFGGANTYSGATTVNTGQLTLAAGSSLSSTTAVTVSGTATLAPNPATGITMNGGASLSLGNGTTFNMVDGVAGIYQVGALNLSGATLKFDLGATADRLTDTGAATVTGTNTISITGFVGGAAPSGTYTLISATSGSLATGFTLGTPVVFVNSIPYGLTMNTSSGAVTVTVAGAPQWTSTAGGSWGLNTNWTPAAVPGGAGALAWFGAATAAAQTVTMDAGRTVGTLLFSNTSGGTFLIDGQANGGPYTLTLDNSGSAPAVTNATGANTINAPIALNGTPTISVASGTSLTFSGGISNGTGSGLTLASSSGATGVLVLSHTGGYSGVTSINGGILNFINGALGTSTVKFGGGTLQYSASPANTQDIATSITNSTSAITIDTNSNNVTFGGVLASSNTGGLTVTDSNATKGSLTLNVANSYTGTTTVNSGGTLKVGIAGALGAATNSVVVNSGGALDLNGINYSTASALSLNGTYSATVGALTNSSGTAATYAGVVTLASSASIGGSGDITLSAAMGTDAATLSKVGNDTLTLSLLSSRTGPITLSAGTLKVLASGAMGTAATSITETSGAALDLSGTAYALASALSINGTGVSNGGALTNSSATAATYAGVVTLTTNASIGGTGDITLSAGLATTASTLTKVGADTLTLSATSSRTGAVSINNGIVKVGNASALGTAAAAVSVTGSAGPAALDLNGITYTSASTLSLNGTYSTTVGSLTNSSATAATYPGVVTLATSSSIGGSAAGSITLSAGLGIDAVTLTKVGTDTLILNAASNRTGAFAINNGIVKVGANQALGTSAAAVSVTGSVAAAALDLNGIAYSTASPLSVSGTYSATVGSLTNSSATAASYGGVVTLGAPASIGGANGSITLSSGLGSDGNTLTKVGSSTLILGGTGSSRTGTVTVSAGTLQVTNTAGSATGTAAVGVSTGGILAGSSAASQGFINGPVTVNGGGTLSGSNGNTLTLGGGLTLSNGGTAPALSFALTATPLGSGVSPFVNITGGGLALTGGTSSVTFTGTAGVGTYNLIQFTGTDPGLGSFSAPTGPAGYTYNLVDTGTEIDVQVAALILNWTGKTGGTGANLATWETGGTSTNWANSANTATTFINNAQAMFTDTNPVSGGGGIGSYAVQVAAAGVTPYSTTFNTASTYTVSNASGTIGIGGTGTLTKQGTGTVILQSQNSYSGGTFLNNGTLNVYADAALGTAPASPATNITFTGNSTLQAGGTVSLSANRNVSIANGVTATFDTNGNTMTVPGVISGGNSSSAVQKNGTGTLSLSSTNSYQGGTTINGGMLSIPVPGALGSGTVTLAGTNPTLQFIPNSVVVASNFGGTAHTNWAFPGVNWTPTVTTANGIDTLSINAAANQNGAAWYTSKVAVSTFTASFVYTGGNTGGMTFALQEAGTTSYGGIRANDLGFVNGGGQQGPSVGANSVALGWVPGNAENEPQNSIGTGQAAAMTFAVPTGIMNLNTGNKIDFTISGSGNSNIINYTLHDETTLANFSGSITLTGTLATILGGSTAYVGFTGATAGATAVQTISNFNMVSGYSGVFGLSNNLAVNATSTIDVSYSGGTASMGTLTMGTSTLNVSNLSGGGGNLTLGAATFSGNPTFAPVTGVTLTLGALGDGGTTARTITVNGAGTGAVTLATAAASLIDGTTFNVTSGKLNSNLAGALGTLAAVNVANGATFSVGASQTIGSLGDYSGPATTASVLLNANTLTVGSTNNLSSTFSGVIGNGTGAGTLIKAGTGTLTLAGASTYSGGTQIQNGTVRAGGSAAIMGTNTVTFGTASTNGKLDVNGQTVTVGGLAVAAAVPTGSVASQIIGNSNATTGTLLYTTGTSTFAGTIQDTLPGGSPSAHTALSLSSGTLTLSGANTYTGATSITGGQLAVGTGGSLGSTPVALSGGTLALNAAGAYTANTITVSSAGALTTGIANAIGGSAALVVSGGTATLGQDHNYSGGTTLSGGTLVVNSNSALGTNALNISSGTLNSTTAGVTVANNPINLSGGFAFTGGQSLNLGTGAVTISTATPVVTVNANTLTVGGPITDSGLGITKAGNGTLILGGTSPSFTGPTTINAGTLSVTGSLGTSAVSVVAGTLGGSGSLGGNVTVSSGGIVSPHAGTASTTATLTNTTGTTFTLNGSTLNFNFGAMGVNDKVATDSLTLTGTSTLNITNLGALTNGLYTLFSYTPGHLTGDHTNFTLGTVPAAFTYTVEDPGNGARTGEIDLLVSLKPTLTWTNGQATGVWNTTDTNWTAGSGNTAYAQVSPVQISNAPGGSITLATGTTLTPYSLTVDNSTNPVSFIGSGSIGDYGGGTPLVKNGTGTLVMNSTTANTYAGGTTINGGTISVATATALGATSGGLAINDTATLQVTGTFSSTRAITLGSGNPAIKVDATQAYTNTTPIVGAGNLNATGLGTIVLGANNTFTGQTIIQAGTVSVGTLAVAGTAQPLGMSTNVAGPVQIGNGTSSTATLAYTGGTTSSAFPITLGSTGGAINVITGTTLTLTGALTGGGTGGLTASGAGTLVLASASNTYSGGTSVTGGGTLRANQTSSLPNAPLSIAAGSTVQLRNVVNISGGGSQLTLNAASAVALSVTGTNVASNAFDTTTNVNDTRWESAQGVDPQWIYIDLGQDYNLGQVKIDWEAAGGSNYNIKVATSAQGTQGNNVVAWTTVGTTTGNTTHDAYVTTTLDPGAVGRYVAMYGTTRFNTYGYSIYNMQIFGTALTGATYNIPALTGGGTLDLSSNTISIGADGSSSTFSGMITGSGGSLVKAGTGVLNLGGAAAYTYTGTTTIQAGTLQLGSSAALGGRSIAFGGTGALDLNGNGLSVTGLTGTTTSNVIGNSGTAAATLTFNPGTGGASTFAGTIRDGMPAPLGGSGQTGLLVSTGTLTLTGANTHSGATSISNGATLRVMNTTGSATGTGTVYVAGTLAGTGRVGDAGSAGAVIVESGGALTPHASTGTIGNLTLTSTTGVTLQDGSSLNFNLGASTSDHIQVNGSLSISSGTATLNLATLAGFTPVAPETPGVSYVLFDATGGVHFHPGHLDDGKNGTGGSMSIGVSPVPYDRFEILGPGDTSGDGLKTGAPNEIILYVSAKLPTVWTGLQDNTWDELSPNWDVGNYVNDGTPVVFDDTGDNTSINITAAYSPGRATFNNTNTPVTGKAYTLGGTGSLAGAGSLAKNGNGLVTINTHNTYTGGTTLGKSTGEDGGILAVSANDSLGFGPLTINNGTLRVTASFIDSPVIGTVATPRNITLGHANSAISVDSGQAFTSNGIIDGSGNLNATGAGTIVLGGSNTFTGQTIIQSGTVSVGTLVDPVAGVTQAQPLGKNANPVVIGTSTPYSTTGATLAYTGATASSALPITLGTGGGAIAVSGSALTLTGAVSGGGTGGLTASGAGTLVLSGANNYTGGTTVSGGTLRVTTPGSLGAGAINVLGTGSFQFSPTNAASFTVPSITGNDTTTSLAVNTNATVNTGSDNSSSTFAGVISGAGILNKVGTGVFTLGNVNSISGGIGIQDGTIKANTDGAVLGTGRVNFGATGTSGTLDLNGHSVTLTGGLGLATGATGTGQTIGNSSAATPATLTYNGATSTFAGSIVDTLLSGGSKTALVVSAGTLTLTGQSTYSGGTTVSGGVLVAGNSSGSATGSGTVTLDGGTLASATTGRISGAVAAGAGAHTIAPGGVGAYGTLNLGSSLTLSANSTLGFDVSSASSDAVHITGAMNALGTVPTLNLNFNSLDGNLGTTTLATFASTDIPLGTGTMNVTGSALNGFSVVVSANDIQLVAPPTLIWTGNYGTWDSIIHDPASFAVRSSGAPAQFQDYSRVLFNYDEANALYSGTITNVNIPGTVTPATLVVDGTQDYTFDGHGTGVIAGPATLAKNGTGTLTIKGMNNTFTGGTSISNGTVNIDSDSALGAVPATAATNITFAGNSTLQAGASVVAVDPKRLIAVGEGRTATFDTPGTNAMSVGKISNASGATSAGIKKTGTGTLTLVTAGNSYAGTTLISGGTLKLGATPGTGGSPAPSILSSAIVNLNAANAASLTVAGGLVTSIANTGSLGGAFTNSTTIQGTNGTPAYNATAINGKPAMVFTSTNAAGAANQGKGTVLGMVNDTTKLITSSQITFFFVENQPALYSLSNGQEMGLVSSTNPNNDWNTAGNMGIDNGNYNQPGGSLYFRTISAGNSGGAQITRPALNTPMILDATLDLTAGTSTSDLVTAAALTHLTGNVTTSSALSINRMSLGGRIGDSNNANTSAGDWAGQIGQVLIFNTALSASDVAEVQDYLKSAWLTGSGTGYLPSATPVQIGSGGTLDLNGYLQQVNSLSDVGGSGGLITNSAAGIGVTLSLATTTNTTFSGSIQNGAGGTGVVGLSISGTGTQHLAGASNYTGATTVNSGTLSLDAPGAISASPITVKGGEVKLTANQRVVDLVLAGGSVDVTDKGVAITASSVGVGSWSGGAYTGLAGQIHSHAIMSSVTSDANKGIGISSGADAIAHGNSTFNGVAISNADVLIQYGWNGDLNMDGVVNYVDYAVIDNSYLTSATPSYANGDVTGDGVINYLDYGMMDNAYLAQTAPHSAAAAAAAMSSSAVPEPAALGLLGLGALGLLARRRRTR